MCHKKSSQNPSFLVSAVEIVGKSRGFDAGYEGYDSEEVARSKVDGNAFLAGRRMIRKHL
jgi:hypothetical protein